MARPLPLPPPGFDDLSVEEKIPVPEWHREIIEDRLAAHRADPGAARPWNEVREELLDELRNRPRQG